MKISLFIPIFSLYILQAYILFAQEEKAYNPEAYQRPFYLVIYDKVSDWVATLGKSDAERKRILAERKNQRFQRFLKQHAQSTKTATKDVHIQNNYKPLDFLKRSDNKHQKSERYVEYTTDEHVRRLHDQSKQRMNDARRQGRYAERSLGQYKGSR